MPAVHCPHCQSQLNVPESVLGKSGKCPKCQQKFVVQLPLSVPPTEDDEYGLSPLDQPAPRSQLAQAAVPSTTAGAAPAPARKLPSQSRPRSVGAAQQPERSRERPAWLIPVIAAGAGTFTLLLCGGLVLWMFGGLRVPGFGGFMLAKAQEPLPGLDSTCCPAPLAGGTDWKVAPDGGDPPPGLKSAFPAFNSGVQSVLFAAPPSGSAALLYSAGATSIEWVQYDLRQPDPVARVTVEGVAPSPLAALSPSGKLLAAADRQERRVVVWSADGRQLAQIETGDQDVRWIGLASDTRLLVLAGTKLTGFELPSAARAMEIAIDANCLSVLSPGGKWVASFNGKSFLWHSTADGSRAGTLHIPDAWFEGVSQSPVPPLELSQRSAGLVIHPSGQMAAGLIRNATDDLLVAVWDLASGKPVRSFRIPHGKNPLPTTATWCGKGHLRLTTGHLIDLELQTILVEHPAEGALTSTPDGRLWRVWSGAPVDTILPKLGTTKHKDDFEKSATLLAATTLPDAQFSEAIQAAHEGFLLNPGAELRIEIDSTVPAAEREKTVEALAYRAAKLGYRVNPEARCGLHIGGDVKVAAMQGELVESYGPNYGKFKVVAGSIGRASVTGVDASGRAMMGTPSYDTISRNAETGGEEAVWRRIREVLAVQPLPRLYLRDPSGKRILLPETKEIGIDGILEVAPVHVPPESLDTFALPQDRPHPGGGKK